MAKIVIIGAGSHVFSRHLITDILTWPELRDGTISLMDISQEPLDLIAGFARRLVKQNGFNTTIQATTRRREALDGADYVFVTIQVGGSKATWPDRELPPEIRCGPSRRRYHRGRRGFLCHASRARHFGHLQRHG